jgi:hypothetical protein
LFNGDNADVVNVDVFESVPINTVDGGNTFDGGEDRSFILDFNPGGGGGALPLPLLLLLLLLLPLPLPLPLLLP